MEKNRRLIWSIILNSLVFILVTFSVLCNFVEVFHYEEGIKRTACFRYFTVDSNILVALCCIILVVCGIKKLNNPTYEIPSWVIMGKFIGTIAVTITFLVSLFYLTPFLGVGVMYTKINFFLHLVAPVLAIVSCLFFDMGEKFSVKQSFLGVIPMAIYSVVYLVMVVVIGVNHGGWEDFYGFNKGGLFMVSFVVMYAFVFALCFGFNLLRNFILTKSTKNEKVD